MIEAVGLTGAAVSAVHRDAPSLGPWSGLGLFCLYTFCLYTAIVLALAAWLLRRRDV